ncbi:hypothetical protein KI387_044588, partial [Taxus chinensis]
NREEELKWDGRLGNRGMNQHLGQQLGSFEIGAWVEMVLFEKDKKKSYEVVELPIEK